MLSNRITYQTWKLKKQIMYAMKCCIEADSVSCCYCLNYKNWFAELVEVNVKVSSYAKLRRKKITCVLLQALNIHITDQFDVINSCWKKLLLQFTSFFTFTGIGIDDTFVMLAAWRRTSVKLSVPERMAHMMSEAAVSITITSLTGMISFLIGIFSQFPSVQIFCFYSAMSVAFTYLWHITFFAACMSVFGHFEHRNLHYLGCEVKPVSVAIKGESNYFQIPLR